MSKPSEILDEYRDRYPEPEHDWRFRAGRMAEQMAMLGTDLLQAQKLLTKARHQRDSLAVTLVDAQRERLTAESKLDSANRIIGEQLATIAVLNRIKPSPDTSRLIKAAKALLQNYEKCPQNPHNDPTIRRRYLDGLRDALVQTEKACDACIDAGSGMTGQSMKCPAHSAKECNR